MKPEKNFEHCVTRMNENLDSVKSWAKGEMRLGLNGLFICENGTVEEYVKEKEGRDFHEFVKNLTSEEFEDICRIYFEGLEKKDLAMIHSALAVFDEMDQYDLGTYDMKRRLLRIRHATQNQPYEIKTKSNVKNFIIYRGKAYLPENHQETKQEI